MQRQFFNVPAVPNILLIDKYVIKAGKKDGEDKIEVETTPNVA